MTDLQPVSDDIGALLDQTVGGPPATEEEVVEAERVLGLRLPSDLVAFYLSQGSADGEVHLEGGDPDGGGVLILNPVREVVRENRETEWRDPRLVLVGTNGGGEAYALDYRFDPPRWVVVPFIDLDFENALPAGQDFAAFIRSIAAGTFWTT